jgi:hypothetical protein
MQGWIEHLGSKDTSELIQALRDDEPQHTEAALEAIHQILAGRQAQRPSPRSALMEREGTVSWSRPRSMRAESNAQVRDTGSKCEIVFPKNGFLNPGRYEFRDWDDVISFIFQAFGLPEQHEGGFSMKRKGKYQRLDYRGRPAFTFGDPILDLVTDQHGWIVVGGERHNLRTMPRAVRMRRRGGIRSLDLTPHIEDIRRAQVEEAMVRGDRFVIVESTDTTVQIASRNPSERVFYSGGAKMRFRAWKSNYKVYWSMGAEIETWGGDFGYARIESDYGDAIAHGYCATMKHDWDSDTNDDYVDEWEWGTFSSPPTGVRSWCSADWMSGHYTGWVQVGGCDYFFA